MQPQDVAHQLDQMDAIFESGLVDSIPLDKQLSLALKSLTGLAQMADALLTVVGSLPPGVLPDELGPDEISLLRNVWTMHDKVGRVLSGKA